MTESSKPEKRSKFGRFLGLGRTKRNPERAGDREVLPEQVSANVPRVPLLIAGDQGANATVRSLATEPPTEPLTEPVSTTAKNKAVPNTDADPEKLPTSVAIAQDRLNKSGDKLKKKLPADLLASGDFQIKVSADVNSLADNIGSTLETFMGQRQLEKSEQSHARDFITEWAKKTMPFIETGATIANNFIPPPYNLIALGVVHVVKKTQAMGDIADKVDGTLVLLSLTIRNVRGAEGFSNVHLNEVRIAAIYLSSAVMDCLTSLIDWVDASIGKKVFMKPDFDEKLKTVQALSALYSIALQSTAVREKHHDDILKWISPDDSSIVPKPVDEVAGSHRVFTDSEPYLNWVGKGPSALICSGQPGVGKSHLVSLIFHRLREDPNLCIAYFFFNHSNRDETAEKVIRALLRQVVAQSPNVPVDVAAEYSRYMNDPHKVPTSRVKLTSLLKSSLEQFPSSPRFILIDAYDEFRNSEEEELQKKRLRSALSEICGNDSAKILITTRPQCRYELKDNFSSSEIAVVKGDLGDVEKYLDDQIQLQNYLHPDLKSNIKQTILDANREEAWFLLAKLQLKFVFEPKDAGEKRRRLSSLPQSPTAAYHGVLERMALADLPFARRILGWVLYAQRILTMSELREALAIKIGVASFSSQDMTSAEEIILTCGGFIDHNEGSNLVTFSHETVRPFLEEYEFNSLPSHSELCRTCLTYLQLPEFENPVEGSQWNERKEEFKFHDYAAHFWATHAVQAKKDVQLVEEAILETFCSEGRRDAIEQLKKGDYYYKGMSLLHIFIEHRLNSIFPLPLSGDEAFQGSLVKAISNLNVNARDESGRTPLHCFDDKGDLHAAKWLVQNGADVNATDNLRSTALHHAARTKQWDMVKWLVEERSVDMNETNAYGWTALYLTVHSGGLDMIKWLVEEGNVDVSAKNEAGLTVLHYIGGDGKWETVKWLVEEGNLDVNAKTDAGMTALHYAARSGRLGMVKWLVEERNVDVNAKCNYGWTALHYAADSDRLDMVKWLVEAGKADIYLTDKNGSTASDYGSEEVSRYLGHLDQSMESRPESAAKA